MSNASKTATPSCWSTAGYTCINANCSVCGRAPEFVRVEPDTTKHAARTCDGCTRARKAIVDLCPRPSCAENGYCTALTTCTLRPPLDEIARRP